jgi:hypothetical protein
LKIWKRTVAGTEVQIIEVAGTGYDHRGLRQLHAINGGYPAVLSACHESRAQAQKIYKLAFGALVKHPVYFANGKDLLLLDGVDPIEKHRDYILCEFPRLDILAALKDIRYVTVRGSWMEIPKVTYLRRLQSRRLEGDLCEILCYIPNLEHIAIVK